MSSRAGMGWGLAVWTGIVSVLSGGHGVRSSTSCYWHR